MKLLNGRVRGDGLHVERLRPKMGDRYGDEGADPGWVGLEEEEEEEESESGV